MNDNDDIPVLNVLREKLVAGIAEHAGQRRRLPVVPMVGVAVAVAVVVALFWAARPGAQGHRVLVRGPLSGSTGLLANGQAGSGTAGPASSVAGSGSAVGGSTGGGGAAPDSTTTVTASSGQLPSPGVVASPTLPPSPVGPPTVSTTTITTTPAPSPTPVVIVLGVGDSGRTVAVAKGSTVEVRLSANSSSIWPQEPMSSNAGVLRWTSGSSAATSSQANFLAVASGTAQLSTYGLPPCAVQPAPSAVPVACPALALAWSVTVSVS